VRLPGRSFSASPVPRFSWWMMVIWLIFLFAALGAVQYMAHAEYAYLLASAVVIVVCAGCILKLRWARPTMQVLALLLALWSITTAVLMLRQWGEFEVARQHAQNEPQLRELALWMVERAQRTWQVGIALKALAIPVLVCLAWQLGRPVVRGQFRPREP
jgi:hypothetical protein